MMRVSDLVVPLGPTIMETQSLAAAVQKATDLAVDELIVLNLHHHPIGVLTEGDVESARFDDPTGWPRRLCVGLLRTPPRQVRPEHTLDELIECYRETGVRPLLVHGPPAGQPGAAPEVHVLHPSAVFRWCAQHRPEIIEELASLAGRSPRS